MRSEENFRLLNNVDYQLSSSAISSYRLTTILQDTSRRIVIAIAYDEDKERGEEIHFLWNS